MDFSKEIPAYFIDKTNTIIQVVFTSIFAFVFINIYHPFNSLQWFEVNEYKYSVFSGLLVLTGMIVVVISRWILLHRKKKSYITVFSFSMYIFFEIALMALFFACYEKYILTDYRPFIELLQAAALNTVLILLIPYLISALFFSWQDYKSKFETVIAEQNRGPEKRFISFYDKNDTLQLTLNEEDIAYVESNENYVIIHYQEEAQHKKFVLRNSMKKMEVMLLDSRIVRIHRGYFANLNRVKRFQKQKKNMLLVIEFIDSIELTVSKTYAATIAQLLDEA